MAVFFATGYKLTMVHAVAQWLHASFPVQDFFLILDPDHNYFSIIIVSIYLC